MPTKIAIGGGHLAIVDDSDAEIVGQIKWHAAKGNGGKTLYAVSADGVPMHRLIVGAKPGEVVDHQNHDGLDNRRSNLRPCSHTQNMQNRGKYAPCASRFKGVTRGYRTRWRASIEANGERYSLGIFATEEEAAREYDRAARRLHGEFARTNEMMGLYEASEEEPARVAA